MKKNRNMTGIDVVALVLALTLALGLAGLLVIAGINVSSSPVLTTRAVDENTTQILTAILGGIVGILGGYIGYRSKQHDKDKDDDDQQDPDQHV